MAGSILPGCAIDSRVYRPRRCSREHTCPVTNTDPCACGAAPAAQLPAASGSDSPVPAPVRLTGWAVVLGIAASRVVLEGQELHVDGLVPAIVQSGRRAALGVGHGSRLVLRQGHRQHKELLLPGQAGGTGGGDDRGPVADLAVLGIMR